MAYNVEISCDGENCNSSKQVPQVGAIPVGWVVVSNVNPSSVTQFQQPNNGPIPPGSQQKTMIFCGWRCAFKYVKSFLRKEEQVAA